MTRPGAVVLVSGGMDSCVAAAISAARYELSFLHLNYGQRTERRELKAFHDLADAFGAVRRLVVSMTHLAQVGGSTLTDFALPVARADLSRSGVPSSYVPFRNAGMLSVAVSWAEVLGLRAVVVGAVEEDSSGYPDCRRDFFEAFQKVIDTGTRPGSGILIEIPVIGLSKAQIVERGMALGAPFQLTWSCYQGEDIACGVCDSCALRLRGFQTAGVADPIPYIRQPSYR
jgi:7-cyano-7-deazaguanine synthase